MDKKDKIFNIVLKEVIKNNKVLNYNLKDNNLTATEIDEAIKNISGDEIIEAINNIDTSNMSKGMLKELMCFKNLLETEVHKTNGSKLKIFLIQKNLIR